MFARRFFYVCAGLLCLALAYHLGATTATAGRPSTRLQCVAVSSGGSYAVKDRYLYKVHFPNPIYQFTAPVPGLSEPIACGANEVGNPSVILDNGEVWSWDGGGGWMLSGTFPQ